MNPKKKVFHNNYKKKKDNLHFIPNNILTIFFFKVNKIYKWLLIVFKLYIYIYIYELYYMHLIVYF